MNNRLYNCHNDYQGKFKRVLCVCSAGLLRSPTAALVLSMPPFNYNTRSAGIDIDFALIPVDEVLIEWADEIVCMSEGQREKLLQMMKKTIKPVICLNLDDNYGYRDRELMQKIIDRYQLHIGAI